jgi:hypothetical protein
MGVELVWQPRSQAWAVWSTVTDSFHAKDLKKPEAVADFVIGNHEYYWGVDNEGKRQMFVCQYHSREAIVKYYEYELAHPRPLKWQEMGESGWVSKELPADQVEKNIRVAYARDIEDWDSDKIRPDPEAKKVERQKLIEWANEVKHEGRVSVGGMKFAITDEGLEPKGRVSERPEPLLPPGGVPEGRQPLYPHVPKSKSPKYPHKS